RKISSNYPNR
ncbi:deoxyribodipyrimidine photo-lyase-related family protein, partial [Vibrio parahaemolyticus V-223/04]